MVSRATDSPTPSSSSDAKSLKDLLANCAREDLAHIGSIQDFAFVIQVAREGEQILACSQNLEELAGQPVSTLLGRSIEDVFGEAFDREKLDLVRTGNAQLTIPSGVKIGDQLYHVTMQCQDDSILIELERPGPFRLAEHERQAVLRHPVSQNDASSVSSIVEDFANRFAALTGYDRVLIYQFMEDWSGKVVAEKGSHFEPSMLGLHFPASDIPPNARKLYESMPSRFIANVASSDVSLCHAAPDAPIDQSRVRSRSSSKAHLLYLKNMGVQSSLSCSIMFKNQLWGLVACHHHEPYQPDLRIRLDCERLSRTLAVELMRVHAERKMQMIENFKHGAANLLDRISGETKKPSAFRPIAKDLLELLDADGFAIISSQDVLSEGLCPNRDELLITHELVRSKTENRIFKVESASSLYPSATSWLPQVAGLLAVGTSSLSKITADDLVFYWFRSEYISSVEWAGKTSKGQGTLTLPDGTPVLSPRSSFEKWSEEKKQHCRPWTSEQVYKANLWVHNLSKKWTGASGDADLDLGETLPFR